MKRVHLALFLGLLLCLSPAHAVRLAQYEAGQVGIVPLFNTSGGMDTLLKISNGSAHSAIRVQFRSTAGERMTAFNVYLAPHEAWRAAVTLSPAPQGPGLKMSDASCVLGAGDSSAIEPVQSDVAIQESFGYIEMLLMGHVEDPGLRSGIELRACDELAAAFSSGLWSADGNTGMSPPTDSMRVHAQLIRVEEGTQFGIDAVHLQQFRDQPFHVPPSEAFGLADARDEGTDSGATRSIVCNDECISQTWVDPRGAVASVLLADFRQIDYVVNSDIGAFTSVVVLDPMHPYYAEGEFPDHQVGFYMSDADEGLLANGACSNGPLPTNICFPPFSGGTPAAQTLFTLNIIEHLDVTTSPPPVLPIFGLSGYFPVPADVLDQNSLDRLTSGSAFLIFWNENDPGPGLVSNEGTMYTGSPAVAVAFSEITNGELISREGNRVRANYGSAQYGRKITFADGIEQ